MKRILTVAVLASLPALAAAQDYVMYETQYMKPKSDGWAELTQKLGEHNKKFHAEGPYAAQIHRVISGPRTGELVWVMGPCTFTHLDSRPTGDPHDSDWMNNVTPLLDGVAETEYWQLDEELSYRPDTDTHDRLRVRFLDIARGDRYRFDEILKKIKRVGEEKQYPNRSSVYRNRFWTTSGRDVAMVWAFDKWAELDDDRRFSADYEDVFGPGTWRLFLDEWRDVVQEAYDEYREVAWEFSGVSPTEK